MIVGFVKQQLLEIAKTTIVADSINYIKAQFLFSTNDWNGLEKTVYFKNQDNTYSATLDEDNIAFPIHLSAGEWEVYMVGREYSKGELAERITTSSAIINVLPFSGESSEEMPEIEMTENERIFATIGNLDDLLTREKSNLVDAINEIYRRGGGSGGGTDGFSPIVDITEIEGGHRVTITDVDGEKTFDVLNGVDGYTPVKGVDYFDGYTPQKCIDYFDGEDYVLTDTDKTEIANTVVALLPKYNGEVVEV